MENAKPTKKNRKSLYYFIVIIVVVLRLVIMISLHLDCQLYSNLDYSVCGVKYIFSLYVSDVRRPEEYDLYLETTQGDCTTNMSHKE